MADAARIKTSLPAKVRKTAPPPMTTATPVDSAPTSGIHPWMPDVGRPNWPGADPSLPQPIPIPLTAEGGAAGTINMSGFISDEEYLGDLAPPKAWRVYREMMRSSARVRASIRVITAPILSASPKVQPAEDGDNVDQGIADFVQAALFGKGVLRDTWRDVLKHLLSRLGYGVAVAEKVWRYDQASGAWLLEALSPRIIKTLYRWVMDPEGHKLVGIHQYGFVGQRPINVVIPRSKCVVSVHDREGDNWWGTSILRSSYLHWRYLIDLYRIDMVGHDRFHVGIPRATLDDTGYASGTIKREARKVLRNIRANEKAWIMQPPGVVFDILQSESGGRNNGVMSSIKHHADMIVHNVMADFISGVGKDGLGSTRTRTLADVFGAVLVQEADEIAEDLDRDVVKELCDLNFDMTNRDYPSVVLSDITDTDVAELVANITSLTAGGWLTPTPEDEDDLRKSLRMSSRPLDHPAASAKPDPALEPDLPPVDPNAPPVETPPTPETTPTPGTRPTPGTPPTRKPGESKVAAAVRLARRADGVRLLGRTPTTLERALLKDVRQVPRRLNRFTDTLAARLASVRLEQLRRLAAQVGKKDASTSTSARPTHFDVPLKTLTLRAIREAQGQVYSYGGEQIRAELTRQGATRLADSSTGRAVVLRALAAPITVATLAGSTTKKKAPAKPDTSKAASTQLLSAATTTAEQINDAWFNRILETANRLKRGGSTDLEGDLVDTLTPEAEMGILRYVKARVNESYAVGRAVEARDNGDDIDRVVVSELIDSPTICDVCDEADGDEYEYGSDEYYANMPPRQDCEGNQGTADACRGTYLYLLKDRTV